MRFQVFVSEFAEKDLSELKHYLVKKFSSKTWEETYSQIKKSLESLEVFPELGSIPTELRILNFKQYRQVLCEMNRIIYEIRDNTIYIHLICDVRRDFKTLFLNRILG